MTDFLKKDDKKKYNKMLRRIKRIAFLYKFLLFAEIGLMFVMVSVAVLQAGIMTDNLFHLNSVLRGLYFVFLISACGYVFIRKFLPFWKKGLTVDESAVLIEQQYPDLNNILINALQLGRQKIVSSADIVALLIRDAYAKTAKANFNKALRFKKFFKLFFCNILLFSLCGSYIYFFPVYWKNGLLRVLNPFSGVESIRRTTLEVFPSIDSYVLNGQDFEVHLTCEGKIPDDAFIYYKIKGEKNSFENMIKDTDYPSRFNFRFKKTVKPFTYFIKAGDAKSKEFNVSVVYPPFVSSIDMKIIYPDYMKKGDEEIKDASGNLSVIKGSSVIMAVKINKKLADMEGAQMVINAREQKIIPFNADMASEVYKIKFVADESFSYLIKLKDKKGFENSDDVAYMVDIVEDNPPTVAVLTPESDIKISEKVKVPLRISAQDDYGLTRAELIYTVNAEEKKKVILRQADLPAVTDATISYLWDIESLVLKQGDVVRYYINVYDNDKRSGFKKAVSNTHFLRVMDLYDKKKTILSKLQTVLYQMKIVFARQMFLAERTKKISKKDKIYFKDSETLAAVQNEINKRINNVSKTLLSLKQNEKALKELEDKLTLLVLPMDKIRQEDLYEYESNLSKMLSDEKIRDRREILKGFASWQDGAASKFFQFWEKGGLIYRDLVQANIEYKISIFIEKQAFIAGALKKGYAKGEDNQRYALLQKSLNDDVRAFIQDIKRDTGLLKKSLLDQNLTKLLISILRTFLKDELILSDMNKALSALKNNEEENALKYTSLALNKLKKLSLNLSAPSYLDVSEKLKKTLNMFAGVEKRIEGFINIEKSFLEGLKAKRKNNKKIFDNEIGFHVRLSEIMTVMVAGIDSQKSGETKKFKRGIKALKKALEIKQDQLSLMRANDISKSMHKAELLLDSLRKAKMYFAKIKEKVKQAEKQAKKKDVKADEKSSSPVVKIVKPGRDIIVLSNAEVPLTVHFKDDYGISSLDLIYMREGDGAEKTINLAEYESLKEDGKVKYVFPVKSLGLSDKTVIYYYARAVDDDIFGKNIGKSSVYRLTVIPPGYILEEDIEEKTEDDKRYEEVKNLVKEVLLVTFEEQRKLKTELSLIKEGKILMKEDRDARYNRIIARQNLLKEEVESVLNIINIVGGNNSDQRITMFLEKVKPVLTDIIEKDIPYIIGGLNKG